MDAIVSDFLNINRNKNMKAVKILIIFPLVMVGYVVGFVWESISVGISAGKRCVDDFGTECAEKHRKGEYDFR